MAGIESYQHRETVEVTPHISAAERLQRAHAAVELSIHCVAELLDTICSGSEGQRNTGARPMPDNMLPLAEVLATVPEKLEKSAATLDELRLKLEDILL